MGTYSSPFRKAFLPLSLVIATLVVSACSQGPESSESPASSGLAPVSSPSASASAESESRTSSSVAANAPVTPVAAFAPVSEAIPSELPNNQCGLDGINDQAAASADPISTAKDTYFSGWAGNGKNSAIGNGFLVLKGTDSSYSVPVTTGDARPDLLKAFAGRGMLEAGFHLMTSFKEVKPGTYSLFVMKSSDASSACDFHSTVTVQ